MMIETSCPSCGKVGNVPAPYLGRTVGCKQCRVLFKVRTATAARNTLAAMVVPEYTPEYSSLDDMPSILVDLPERYFQRERVPA